MGDFKADFTPGVEHAITLEQYRRLNLTRPYTDQPIGHSTLGARTASARASRIVTPTPDPYDLDGPRPVNREDVRKEQQRVSTERKRARREAAKAESARLLDAYRNGGAA